MLANTLSFTAFAVAAVTGVSWYRRMQAVRIPADRRGFIGAMALALVLGSAALLLGPGSTGKIAAWIAATGGGVFVVLNLLSGQERREPALGVGAALPHFQAVDETGTGFDSSSLGGRPFLLKFFRGHW